MAGENVTKVSPDGVRIEQVVGTYDGKEKVQKDRVAEAVRKMRPRAPINQAAGFFKHPSTFEEEEVNYVVDCLKQNIPVYMIANMLQCERHTLYKLINGMPELKELKDAKYENMVDDAEFQLDRLNKAGNASTIIFTLQTMGYKRGWGGQGSQMEGEGQGGRGGGDRIVMGVIPDEEVAKAEETVKEIQAKNGGSVITDPMAMAMMQETVKEEVEKAVEAAKPEAIDEEDVEVSEPPYGGGESVVGLENQNSVNMYTNMGGYGGSGNDPWASGGDSMFFQ